MAPKIREDFVTKNTLKCLRFVWTTVSDCKKTNRAARRWKQPPKKPLHHVSRDKILYDSWSNSAALAWGSSDRHFEWGEGPGDEVRSALQGTERSMTDVLTTFWRPLYVNRVGTHSLMEYVYFIHCFNRLSRTKLEMFLKTFAVMFCTHRTLQLITSFVRLYLGQSKRALYSAHCILLYNVPGLHLNLAEYKPSLGLGMLLLIEAPVERAWGLATPSLTGKTDASAACTSSWTASHENERRIIL